MPCCVCQITLDSRIHQALGRLQAAARLQRLAAASPEAAALAARAVKQAGDTGAAAAVLEG